MLVDLKGSSGYLTEQGSLYDAAEDSLYPPTGLWDPESFQVTTEPEKTKTPFVKSLEEPTTHSDNLNLFDFENDVTIWADYLVPRFHPRSVNIVKEYQHKSNDKPFNIFNFGSDLWRCDKFQDDFSDKIRSYVEESDFMQGFQVKRFS